MVVSLCFEISFFPPFTATDAFIDYFLCGVDVTTEHFIHVDFLYAMSDDFVADFAEETVEPL
jgi:hypothetical protein